MKLEDHYKEYYSIIQTLPEGPLFCKLEINPTELCNRTCSFCPRGQGYPNKNEHISLEVIDKIFKDLKELKKRKYLCPENIKYISSHKNVGSALSGILLKPYYTNISIIDRLANWDNPAQRWAVPPKEQVSNPCTNE